MTKAPTKPGRPKGASSQRRDAIAQAAREQFASVGYAQTTIRSIAKQAGVDPKLVMHYFESKQQLFVSTMEPPAQLREIPDIASAPRESWPDLFAQVILSGLTGPSGVLIESAIRAISSEADAAQLFRESYFERMVLPMVASFGVSQPKLRAQMLGATITGLIVTGRIIGLEDFFSAPPPVQQRLLASFVRSALFTPLSDDELEES